MLNFALKATMAAALLATGAATTALADPAKTAVQIPVAQSVPSQSSFAQSNFTGDIDPTGPWTIKPEHHTFQFGGNGRWGLKLDMEQPLGRDMDWKDVKAGAYLKLTPSIRVGGSVGLGDKLAQPQKITPDDTAPRVHLETAFKF